MTELIDGLVVGGPPGMVGPAGVVHRYREEEILTAVRQLRGYPGDLVEAKRKELDEDLITELIR